MITKYGTIRPSNKILNIETIMNADQYRVITALAEAAGCTVNDILNKMLYLGYETVTANLKQSLGM